MNINIWSINDKYNLNTNFKKSKEPIIKVLWFNPEELYNETILQLRSIYPEIPDDLNNKLIDICIGKKNETNRHIYIRENKISVSFVKWKLKDEWVFQIDIKSKNFNYIEYPKHMKMNGNNWWNDKIDEELYYKKLFDGIIKKFKRTKWKIDIYDLTTHEKIIPIKKHNNLIDMENLCQMK